MGYRRNNRRHYRKKRDLKTLLYFVLFLVVLKWPILLFIVAVVFLIKYFTRKTHMEDSEKISHETNVEESSLPYEKKESHITEAEKVFYNVLKEVVADRYDIQRQVLLSTLVDTTSRDFKDSKGRHYNPDRSRIDRKTVDFVLFNKEDLSPYLAIELDDSSHEREDRKSRDALVEEVLSETGIRLVRVKWANSYNPQTLEMILNL